MNREEFLKLLQSELAGMVSETVIREQISYYQSYIDNEVSSGKAEETVISALGDPRLLARTISDAAEAGGDRVARETPFRYESSDINYNSDEEDLRYQGAAAEEVRGGFFREREGQFETKHPTEEESGAYMPGQEEGPQGYRNKDIHIYPVGGAGCFLISLIFLAVLCLIGMLIGGVFALLSPVLLPMLVVLVLLWIMKGIMDR